MLISNRKEPILLLLGDILMFFASLWLMLLVRYGEIPNVSVFNDHLIPFSILFVVWLVVFFVAGMYEKHTLMLKSKIPTTILNAQAVNSVIGVLFFYLIPYFGITPKTNLFVYLIISFLLTLIWRNYGIQIIGGRKIQRGIIIGNGKDVDELEKEINHNPRYNLKIIGVIDPDKITGQTIQEKILDLIYTTKISTVMVDMQNKKLEPLLPGLYTLILSSKTRFVDLYKVYEEIFDRVPMSLVKHSWFLENLSTAPRLLYDILKRLMDVIISFVFWIVSLIFYPFVYLAIKKEDKGNVFIYQDRVGEKGKPVRIIKFRTMSQDDQKDNHLDKSKTNKITKVGKFLRKTRIDELPQLWNVLKGDLSLIGPRPEMPSLATIYEKEIPYYSVRYLIKPGLSGWAQLYQTAPPKFQAQTDETKTKLSYDLYYIKNRSVLLDFKIALKTIKILLSRSGV